MTSSGPTI